jgi:hypothetical protein
VETAETIYRPILSRSASSARWRGVARPCSHSCNVRRETLSFSAACDWERSFLFRQAANAGPISRFERRLMIRLMNLWCWLVPAFAYVNHVYHCLHRPQGRANPALEATALLRG